VGEILQERTSSSLRRLGIVREGAGDTPQLEQKRGSEKKTQGKVLSVSRDGNKFMDLRKTAQANRPLLLRK